MRKAAFAIFCVAFLAIAVVAQSPPVQQFDIGNITGSVTLPIGASTESTQQQVLATLTGFAPGGTGTVKIQDGSGNPLTSQANGPQRALDIGIDVAGNQIDPRNRNWVLSSPGDQVTAIQGSPPWVVTGPLTDAQLRASAVVVDGSGVTQPISAVALPLPAGASTSALQTTANTSLASIDGKLTAPISVTGPLTDTQLRASAVPVSVASLPLPAGAATEATLSGFKTANHTDLGTINTTLGSPFQAGGSIGNTSFGSSQVGTWTVQQGSPPWSVSQSGSWTVTANAGTNLNTSALALDTSVNGLLLSQGSATSAEKGPLVMGAVTASAPSYTTGQTSPLSLTTSGALRTDSSAITQPISGTTTANQGTPASLANAWPVKVTDGTNTVSVGSSGNIVVSGLSAVGVAPTLNPVSVAGVDGGGLKRHFLMDTSGRLEIDTAQSLPLPAGASTSANQTNGTQKTQIVDASNNVYGPTTTLSAINYLPVVQASSGTPGSAVPARSTVIAGSDGVNVQTISTDTTGKINLNNIVGTITLPTGAATAAGVAATQPRNITQFGGTNISTGTGAGGAGIPRVTVSNDTQILSALDFGTAGTITTTCATPTAACPAGSFVALAINGVSSSQVQISGTFTGATLNVDGTLDGTTWVALQTGSGASGTYSNASFSATGKYRIPRSAGLSQLRVRASALATGSVVAQFNASIGTGPTEVFQQNNANMVTSAWTFDGSGNAITSSGGSLNVIANAGTNLNTSALALDTSVSGLSLSQGSTTAAQKGVLQMGAVTTAAPTYTTAQTSPLSLKTTGELRVADAAAESSLAQIVTNTATANSDTIVNGNITAVCTDANINACGAGSTVSISAFGIYTVTASITGTWVATLVIDGQYGDNTWGKIGVLVDGTNYAQISQFTSNTKLVVQSGGYQNIRIRANAFTSGTAAIGLEASIAQKSVVAITIPNTWNATHITGAATTTIKTGPGVLHAININNGNAGSTSVFLNTTGTGSSISVIANTSETPFPFDTAFITGLTIVTTNATTDVTVFWQFPWFILFFGFRKKDQEWLLSL